MRVSWIMPSPLEPNSRCCKRREGSVWRLSGKAPRRRRAPLTRRSNSPRRALQRAEPWARRARKSPAEMPGSYGIRRTLSGDGACAVEAGEHRFCFLNAFEANNALADGVTNEVGAIAGVELGHDVRLVRFHGLHADVELVGDALVRVPLGDELKHFAFARCQCLHAGALVRALRLV